MIRFLVQEISYDLNGFLAFCVKKAATGDDLTSGAH